MTKTIRNEPKGMGGWLLLPLAGLISDLVWMAGTILDATQKAFNDEADPAHALQSLWKLALFDAVFVALIVWLLSLSYRRSTRFPVWMRRLMLLMGALAGMGLLVQLAVASESQKAVSFEALIVLLSALVWFAYFKYSKRVRNTYTRP